MIDPILVHVIVVIFVATLIRSTLGFGQSMIAVPLLALRIPIEVAAPLAVLVSVIAAGVIVAQDWQKVDVRSAAWLTVSSWFGVPLGLLVLTRGNEHVVKTALGVGIVLFSAYSLRGKMKWRIKDNHHAWMLGAGFCSGFLNGAYGMNGPPVVVYGSMRGWSPQHFRATLQGYFFPASLVGMAGYAAVGLWVPAVTRYFWFSLPGVLAGLLIGRWLNHRLHGDGFFRYVYVGLIVLGAVLTVQGIWK